MEMSCQELHSESWDVMDFVTYLDKIDVLFDIKINARCDGGDLVIYLTLTLT